LLKLEDYNKGLIYTEVKSCIDCNKCIHECPILKSNVSVMDKDGSYKMCVDENECILCGTCLDTCIHDVRHYRDDFEKFLFDLEQGKTFSVLIAPAFYLNYPDEHKYIMGYLRSLGVKSFYPVGFGADITTWGYLNYLSKNNTAKDNIAQPCPSIVRHIEKHMPELLPNLIPIQSPMMCTAIYLRRYKGIQDEFALLSPCVAKKVEIESKRGLGLIRHNITFKTLMEHIKNQGVNLHDYPCVEDEIGCGMGSLFPAPGGLRENIEYYLGPEASIIQIEGERKAYKFLSSLATRDNKQAGATPALVDILNCDRGCSYGTGTEFRNDNSYAAAYQAIAMRKKKYNTLNGHNQQKLLDPADRLARLNETFKDLRIEDFICEYEADDTIRAHVVTDAEIEAIFKEKLVKLTDNAQHVDCAACGYKTCRDMAEAIAHGINHHGNCVYYVKSSLTKGLEELRAAEEGLRTIIDNMPLVSNIFNKNFEMQECNEEAVNLFGLRDKQEYFDRFFDLSPPTQPDGRSSTEKSIAMKSLALKTGYARFEWVHQTLDGELIPCDITLTRISWRGEDHVLTFIRDLREFYKNQENIRMMEQRLKVMLDTSPILCAIYDENYKVIETNQVAADLFGLTDKQVYIDRLFDLCPEYQPDGIATRDKVPQVLKLAFETGHAIFEFMHQTMDGRNLIPCEVHLKRVNLGEKKVVIAYVRDLREQKDMLSKLEDALDREQAANRAKTRFLSNMSHEIRTPMNVVLGITELQLQKDTHPPETEDAFMRVYNSSNLLLTIINDILDLSKVEAGKMEIIPAAYEVASMIIDTVQLNLMYIGSKRIEFTLNVDENIPAYLIGDELRVKQILNNLLTNAFKYTIEGTVILSFGIEAGEAADEVVLVARVSDTGQGMTHEQTGSLFDSEFVRFNLENNRYIEGSGLGLNIAHKLTHMMGGDISVESEPGKGSTFTAYLPHKKKDGDILGSVAAVLQNLKDTQVSLKRASKLEREPMPYGRVLVVDDVESNLYVAKGFLRPYKIAVETVESGKQAISKIDEGKVYDIIFMDHMMPEMDGVEATKIIRSMGYKHPIIALTANAFSDSVAMFMSNGFSGFISKPIDINHLDRHLIKFIYDKQTPEVIKNARMAKANLSNPEMDAALPEFFLRDAKKAVGILEPLAGKQKLDTGELKAYIIQAHAMKSALYNIGRAGLSETAEALEMAGRGADIQTITAVTPRFLACLQEVIKELEPREEQQDVPDEDPEFLRSQMLTIWEACGSYNVDAARDALQALKQKTCSKKTRATLSDLADYLLIGDFEEAGKLAKHTATQCDR